MVTHKDLEIWKEGMELVEVIYRITGGFPDQERFRLTMQMRRSAVSSDARSRFVPMQHHDIIRVANDLGLSIHEALRSRFLTCTLPRKMAAKMGFQSMQCYVG
jgi:23S rRNA-intervening sequence protein